MGRRFLARTTMRSRWRLRTGTWLGRGSFAERCYESRVVVEGEDSEDAARAKGLMEKPSGHRLYGTSMKWKQGLGKVPRGMGEEAFESWLIYRARLEGKVET